MGRLQTATNRRRSLAWKPNPVFVNQSVQLPDFPIGQAVQRERPAMFVDHVPRQIGRVNIPLHMRVGILLQNVPRFLTADSGHFLPHGRRRVPLPEFQKRRQRVLLWPAFELDPATRPGLEVQDRHGAHPFRRRRVDHLKRQSLGGCQVVSLPRARLAALMLAVTVDHRAIVRLRRRHLRRGLLHLAPRLEQVEADRRFLFRSEHLEADRRGLEHIQPRRLLHKQIEADRRGQQRSGQQEVADIHGNDLRSKLTDGSDRRFAKRIEVRLAVRAATRFFRLDLLLLGEHHEV